MDKIGRSLNSSCR